MEEVKGKLNFVICPCITFKTLEQARDGLVAAQKAIDNLLLVKEKAELKRVVSEPNDVHFLPYWKGTDIPVQRWPIPQECYEGFYILDPLRHDLASEYELTMDDVSKVYKSIVNKVPTAVPQSFYSELAVT